jgi:hypothetical protein
MEIFEKQIYKLNWTLSFITLAPTFAKEILGKG